MLPMPILAWPWISILDSMPTGMSQRDLSRVSTFCGVGANKLGEQRSKESWSPWRVGL